MCPQTIIFLFLFVITTSFIVPLTSEKQLPAIDHPRLRWMIDNDIIFVDKTKYLSLMLESKYTFFFLSRPRRFGKSLLLDVMNEFFTGEKKLFENTYIYKLRPDYRWSKYPVIRIDFTDGISSRTVEKFREGMTGKLKDIAESFNIYSINKDMSPEQALGTLIYSLKNNTGLDVVILIDEYDAPYATSYEEPDAPKILKVLQSFFRTLKAQISNIRFLFFTGSSKVAISEFMTATTALDLSLMPEYAGIVGFTEEELDRYFESAVQRVMKERDKSRENIRKEMKSWHDGFQFAGTGERVYNPCSVIKYLETKGEKKLFWSESGGLSTILMKKFLEFPKYVYDYISKYATSKTHPEDKERPLIVPESILSGTVDIAEETYKSLLAILYSGGYFSIDKQHNQQSGYAEPHYILRFSNLEVEMDYIKRLSTMLLKTKKRELEQRIEDMREALESCNWKTFISRLESIFAVTPYFLYKDKRMNEAMFQFQMYVIMFEAGYNPDMEVMTSSGRADLVIKTSRVYIMEPKLITNDENPVAQCRDKYLKRFMNDQEEIVCIGLKFSQNAAIPKWGVAHFSIDGTLLEEHGPIKLSNLEVSESDEFASEGKPVAQLCQILNTSSVPSIFEEEEYKDVLSFNKFAEFISKCENTKDAPRIVKEYTEDISGLTKLLDKVYEKIEHRILRGRITRIKNALKPRIKKTSQ